MQEDCIIFQENSTIFTENGTVLLENGTMLLENETMLLQNESLCTLNQRQDFLHEYKNGLVSIFIYWKKIEYEQLTFHVTVKAII